MWLCDATRYRSWVRIPIPYTGWTFFTLICWKNCKKNKNKRKTKKQRSSFDREDERYSFAVAQPYSLSRYNMYMKSVLESEFDFLRTEQIGQTIQERPLELITLSDPINHEPVSYRNPGSV